MNKEAVGEKTAAMKAQQRKNFIAKYGSLIALIVLVIIISLIKPRFLSFINVRNMFRLVSINGLLAVGMTFVCLTGGIDLSVGAVMGCAGMYSAYFAQVAMNQPAIVAIAVGVGVGLLIGVFNGVCVAYLKVPAFVGTLGSMSIAKSLTFLLTDSKPIPNLSESFKFIGGGMIGNVLPIPVIIFAVILLVCFLLLYKTRYGRYVFAVGGNANAARVSGINVKRIIATVYILSGVLSALAGVITSARVTSGVTNTGDGYETDAIAMVVIGGTSLAGGKGRLWGTVVGIMLMTCLSSGLDMLGVGAYYQMLVKGFVVILAVMLDGLSSD
ncbi:ABC transporter permease [Massilistercora timonensis]|uniref:ABC transporter permease n=1 Tax=Massilistercora timonensis TaxID=2086584 RepID=UPI00320A9796